MGASHDKERAAQAHAQGVAEASQAESRRLQAEDVRAELTRQLGTNVQAADPRLAQYAQRYQVDQSVIDARNTYNKRQRQNPAGDVYRTADQANQLMAQAEQAARAGDWAQAEELRKQADAASRNIFAGYSGALSLRGGAEEQASSVAGTVQGQIVSRQLQDARSLQERGAEYDELTRRLNDPALEEIERNREIAERAVVSGRTAAERQVRDLGASRAAGYSQYRTAAAMGQVERAAALDLANVHSEAGRQAASVRALTARTVEEHRANFAQSAVKFASDWTNQQAGIRDEYFDALDRLSNATMQMSSNVSSQWMQMAMQSEQAEEQKKANRRALTTQLVAMGAMALTGGIAGAMAPALFGATSTLGGFGSGVASGLGIGTPQNAAKKPAAGF